jgi:hypothetical protein
MVVSKNYREFSIGCLPGVESESLSRVRNSFEARDTLAENSGFMIGLASGPVNSILEGS